MRKIEPKHVTLQKRSSKPLPSSDNTAPIGKSLLFVTAATKIG